MEKMKLQPKKRWWGKWQREGISKADSGNLFIYNVSNEGFNFNLFVQKGAHLGEIEKGFAKFVSEDEAIYSEKYDNEPPCILHFLKRNDVVQIKEDNCAFFHGMRAYFGGDYKLQKDIFWIFDNIIDDIVLSKIYRLLTDKYWEKFLICFDDISEEDDIDGFNAKIIKGGVVGLYTIYEAILMIGENKEIWGAFLYPDTDSVYYFTSEDSCKDKLPKTIDKWREKFKDRRIIYLKT